MRDVRKWLGLIAASAVIAAVSSMTSPRVASATSCAALDGDVVTQVGGAPLIEGSDVTLYSDWDLTIVGTVTSVDTNEATGSDDYGATETTFTVLAAIGVDTIGPRVVVWSADPGWMNGYPFAVGGTYLVPLRSPGIFGHPLESFVCDPIRQLSPQQAVDLLAMTPDDQLVATPPLTAPPTSPPTSAMALTSPVGTSEPSPGPTADNGDTGSARARAWAGGIGLGAIGVGVTLGLRGRRRAHVQS